MIHTRLADRQTGFESAIAITYRYYSFSILRLGHHREPSSTARKNVVGRCRRLNMPYLVRNGLSRWQWWGTHETFVAVKSPTTPCRELFCSRVEIQNKKRNEIVMRNQCWSKSPVLIRSDKANRDTRKDMATSGQTNTPKWAWLLLLIYQINFLNPSHNRWIMALNP